MTGLWFRVAFTDRVRVQSSVRVRIRYFAGNVTCAGWQVTPCEPTRHVNFRNGESTLVRPAVFCFI